MGDASASIVHGIPLEEQPGIGPLTIAGYLREVVRRHGPAEAVVMRSGGERLSWSYDELLARSMDVARALIATGAGKDTRVGILMTNRPEFLTALFGTALAGGVPVALSTFATAPELDYMLRASQISTLLFEQNVLKKDFHALIGELEPGIAGSAPGLLASIRFPFLQRLVSIGGIPGSDEPLEAVEAGAVEAWGSFLTRGDGIADDHIYARADSVVPSDIGGIFFSSGTTSLPKGIIHSQRAFAIQWWRWAWSFAFADPVRSWTGNGFFWSGNVSMVLGTALSTGGAVILQRTFDAEEALDLFEREGANFINGRPHQWARLQAADNWARADLSSVKYVPRGQLIWEHPTVETDWLVPMAFGTTETMTICTGLTADATPEEYAGSFGKPFPGNTLKIIDPLTRVVKPIGERGEMCIKGPTLMMGYLGKAPEQCFDPEGFFCTGDGGYVDAEGRFFWEGRLTDMIKTGGANVAPDEVDAVIARFPGVKRTQTVGVPNDLLGEMVVSCIVPLPGTDVAQDELTAFLKGEIASYKVPKHVLLCDESEFAITGSEKIKSETVRQLAMRRLNVAVPSPAD